MREIENKIPNFLRDLIKYPELFQKENRNIPFTIEEFEDITNIVRDHLKDISNLVILGDNFKDVLIIGDTHGFLESTLRIIRPFLNGTVGSMLFLGDYVDRGPYSLLNLVLILALMLAWPERIGLLRGNHENLEMNSIYGFKKELLLYYPSYDVKKVGELLDIIYEHLSLAAITPQESIAFHAGIPNVMNNINELKVIPKPHSLMIFRTSNAEMRNRAYRIFEQIQWNDPREDQTSRFIKSFRGPNIYYFNYDVVKDFLKNSNLKRIVRAHESSRGGFQKLFNGKLLHIFSTEPYFGKVSPAFVIHEQSDGKTILRDLDFNRVKEI
ncbi:MAG: metallophosphoesterase family protein [Promethearchaeota archaeon]